ncbi:hypothetical protein Tco_1314098 [Tanacetum coccineum]
MGLQIQVSEIVETTGKLRLHRITELVTPIGILSRWLDEIQRDLHEVGVMSSGRMDEYQQVLQSADRRRQRAMSELLETDRRRREEMRELRAADRTRQQQIVQTLTSRTVTYIGVGFPHKGLVATLQGQVTDLQGQVMTLQGQVTTLQGQQGPAGGPAQPELPEEAGSSS